MSKQSRVMTSAIIESGSFIEEGCFIGHNVVIRPGCRIGPGTVIGHNSVIEENVHIGERVRIQAQVYLTKGTFVGHDAFIGPCVVTSNDKKILSHGRGEWICRAPVIKRFSRIGAGSVLLPGVKIGINAMVGAGSVVTTDVPDGELWYGLPARFARRVPKEETLSDAKT